MKKSILLPMGAALLSVFTFFLRKNQIANVKDPETLLYATNSSETMVLMGTILLFLAILGGLLCSGGRPLPNYTYTVYCPNPIFVSLVATGSLLLILSVIVGFLDIKSQYDLFVQAGSLLSGESFRFPWITALFILFVAVTGLALLSLGKQAYRGQELVVCWLTFFPVLVSMFRMIVVYRESGPNPNLQDKFYVIIGIIFTVLAYYHLSATAYEGPRPRLIIFFSLGSVVFCGSILGGEISIYESVLHLGLNLNLLAISGAILENTYSSRENYRTPPPPKGESFFTEKQEDITNSITQEDGI